MAKITYTFHDEYVEGVTKSGHSFIISLEDYSFVSRVSWHSDKDGYLRNRNLGYMHRLINETPTGMQTDHINRIKTDNRRSNLRTVTQSENELNKPIRSGKGVQKNHNCKTWTATIRVNKVSHYLGSFKTKEEALEARRLAEINLTA